MTTNITEKKGLASKMPRTTTAMDPFYNLPKDTISPLLKMHLYTTDWTHHVLKLISHILNACKMLPEFGILKELQLQLVHLFRIVLLKNRLKSVMPNGIIFDHLVGIVQDIWFQVKHIHNNQNIVLDHLVGSILAMLKISASISDKTSIDNLLKRLLSQVLSTRMSLTDQVSEIPEKLLLLMEADPNSNSFPVNVVIDHIAEISEYLQSMSDLDTGPIVWIPKTLLLLILNIIRRLPNFQDSHKDIEAHLIKILDPLCGKNMKTILNVCVLPEDWMSLLKFMNVLTWHKNVSSAFLNISRIKCPNELLQYLVYELQSVCEMLPKGKLLQDLHSQLINLDRILSPESRIWQDAILDHLSGILLDILSQVKKINHVNTIQNYQIMDSFTATVKTLLVLSVAIPEMSPITKLLEDMLLQVMNITWIESGTKKTENIQLQIEQELENIFLLAGQLVDRLSEFQWYMQSHLNPIKDSAVLVPRHLLLLSLNIPNMVPYSSLREGLQTHITKILDAVTTCKAPIDPVDDHISVSSEDLRPLLADLDHLTGIPKKLVLKFLREELVDPASVPESKTPNHLLSLLVNISWVKWKLKVLVSQLKEACKMLPETVFHHNLHSRLKSVSYMLPDLSSQLMSTSDMDPSIKVPNEEIMEHLVGIIEDMTSEVTGIDIKILTSRKAIPVGMREDQFEELASEITRVIQTSNIAGHLRTACQGLLSISLNMPKMSCTSRELLFLLRIFTMEPLTKAKTMSLFKDGFVMDRPKKLIEFHVSMLLRVFEIVLERESMNDLQSKVINVLENVVCIKNEMRELVEIFKHLMSHIIDNNHLSEMNKFKVLEPLRCTITNLRYLSISLHESDDIINDMTSIIGILSDMLGQIEYILYKMELVSEMPKSLQLLIERDPKSIPMNSLVDHLLELKWYLQVLIKNRKDAEVVVPRNLLLLPLNTKEILLLSCAYDLQMDLETFIMKMANASCGTHNGPMQNFIRVSPENLEKLLYYLEILTMHIPQIYSIKEMFNYSATQESGSKFLETAEICFVDARLKNLISELRGKCRLFPENKSIKNLESKIMEVLRFPDFTSECMNTSTKPKQIFNRVHFLDHLFDILQDMLSQAIEKDSNWQIPKIVILDDLEKIIQEIMSTFMRISTKATTCFNNELNKMLSVIRKVSEKEWASEKLKVMVLRLMDVCGMLPESEYLLSKLAKIYWIDPATGLSNNALVGNLVSVLHDLMSHVTKLINSENWILRNIVVEHLIGVIKYLLGKFKYMHVCELTFEYKKLKNMLSTLMNAYSVE